MSDLAREVVERVAEVTGTEPTSLPPLHGAIHADALESIFSPSPDGARRTEGTLSFAYAGCQVVVQSAPDSEPDLAIVYARTAEEGGEATVG